MARQLLATGPQSGIVWFRCRFCRLTRLREPISLPAHIVSKRLGLVPRVLHSVNLISVSWILTGPPHAGHAGAKLLSDFLQGKALSTKCASLVAVEYRSGSTDWLATSSPRCRAYCRPAITLSRITLRSNSAMAAMVATTLRMRCTTRRAPRPRSATRPLRGRFSPAGGTTSARRGRASRPRGPGCRERRRRCRPTSPRHSRAS